MFDTKTDKFVTRIAGFVGATTKSGNASGPNGLVVVNGGAQLWVSDGDSTIKVVDLKTHTIVATFSDRRQAAGPTAWPSIPTARTVIVANSNDEPTFLSLISTEPGHKILAKLPVPQSAENLERSAWHAPSGTFFTAIPVFSADKSKGMLAQTDPKKRHHLKLHELERCHPHSLSIVSDTTIFLGCSTAHGPNRKPGGDMAIFDIASGKIEGYARRPGRQWRLDRRCRSAGSTITPPPTARWSWSTPRPASSCRRCRPGTARARSASISRPTRSMSPPPPRAAPAAAASWCSLRRETMTRAISINAIALRIWRCTASRCSSSG